MARLRALAIGLVLPFAIPSTGLVIGATAGLSEQPAGRAQERPTRPEGPKITYESLIWDLADRSTFTYFPDPAYNLRASTSRDPASTDPNDESTWFSTDDSGHYVRTIEREDRIERVMLDAAGPGVITRIFAEYPTGTLRIYIDEMQNPLIEETMEKFLAGKGTWTAPMCDRTGKGWSSFVPIPFAERCVITHDGDPLAYEVEYRDYDEGAPVISLTAQQIEDHRRLLYAMQRSLVLARAPRASEFRTMDRNIEPGESVEIWSIEGPGEITELGINSDFEDRNRERGLRSLVMRMEFDGRETVWCPVGDFYGTAPGINQYKSWRTVVDQMNWLLARWYMPFKESAKISIENRGAATANFRSSIRYRTDYEWNDRSMYFHAAWRFAYPVPTRPIHDWNVIEIDGRGVFVGDALAVTNPVQEWWGAGAPKIYVDNESVPSVFSNSIDHYYGFSVDSGEGFQSPFHSRPRHDGPANYGHALANRQRGLGGVPFDQGLRFDIGLVHEHPEASAAYAATAYWYALPGSSSNATTYDDEVLQAIPDVKRQNPTYLIENAEEGESLPIIRTSPNLTIHRRPIATPKLYSQDAFLFASPDDIGAVAEISVPVPEPGRYRLTAYMATCPSCGMVFFVINDEETPVAVDLYNKEDPYDFGASGPADLGEWDSIGDEIILKIEVIGTNDRSDPPHYNWGIDAIVAEKVE